MLTVHCPKCGSTDIRERNVAYASLPVTGWDVDDDGDLHPTDYDTDVSVDWDCTDLDPYVCNGCGKWEGAASHLFVRGGR